jgi:hypothetical protein
MISLLPGRFRFFESHPLPSLAKRVFGLAFQAMSYLVRRAIQLLLILTAILLALSVGYRHAFIGKQLTHSQRLTLN